MSRLYNYTPLCQYAMSDVHEYLGFQYLPSLMSITYSSSLLGNFDVTNFKYI